MADHFMQRAIELSLENVLSGHGGPFADVVVKDGEIIGEGTNQVTSTNDPSAHAEVLAIRQACRRIQHFKLAGCCIYSSCEPCPMCLGLIYWAAPEKVFYGNTRQDAAAIGFDDSRIYRELGLPQERRALPMAQMMRQEAQEAFRAWRAKPDKIPY